MIFSYDPVLELRKFLSGGAGKAETEAKLAELAAGSGMGREEILSQFIRGEDIPDPAICEREAIEEFARENGLTGDAQVRAAIALARPVTEFRPLKAYEA